MRFERLERLERLHLLSPFLEFLWMRVANERADE